MVVKKLSGNIRKGDGFVKKIISLVLSLAVVIGVLPIFPVFANNESTVTLTGSGTSENPYLISNAAELKTARDLINGESTDYASMSFKLTDDIDFDNKDWTPIGWYHDGTDSTDLNYDRGFKGIFDGDGHVIKNLVIKKDKGTVAGFFGYLEGSAQVNDLGLENVDLRVGGNEDSITAAGCLAGGTQNNVKITRCYVKKSINKAVDAKLWGDMRGALIGVMYGVSSVTDCYVYDVQICSGRASAQSGFIGLVNNVNAEIQNCYSAKVKVDTQNVTNSEYVAAFAPFTIKVNAKTIANCWSDAVALSGSAYGDYQTTEKHAGIPGATKDGIVKAMTDAGFAVDENVNDGYPCLGYETGWDGTSATSLSGDGTESNPYKIGTAAELAYFRDRINIKNKSDGAFNDEGGKRLHFELTEDIDLNNREWIPIGNNESAFRGFFDGKNHVVKNVKITSLDGTNISYGLFGVVSGEISGGTEICGGHIYNLGIENLTLNSPYKDETHYGKELGGLTGRANGYAVIKNCYVKNSLVQCRIRRSAVCGTTSPLRYA